MKQPVATAYVPPPSHKKDKDGDLQKVKRLFLQLLRNYPDGAISIIDRNYNFVYTGGELHTRLNADPDELMGNAIYPRFPEELRIIIQSKLKEVFEGNVVSGYELPLPLKGIIYSLDAFPLREENDRIVHAGAIIRNISSLKKAEEELRISYQKEKELGELKSRFVSMASHEFRTPLSTILSSAYLLDKYTRTEDHDKRKKHINQIVSSVNALTEILNDFLSVSKIEEGKITVRPAPVQLKDFVSDFTNEMRNILKKGQKIHYEHSGEVKMVIDCFLLKHILANLLSNAIKFSPENASIDIRTKITAKQFTLSVKDQGIGVPSDEQKYLFQRFFRGTNASNIQGTGLGLHIVSKYAELLNGEISCRSAPDEGTEFTLRINL